jgi:hypothetical protein
MNSVFLPQPGQMTGLEKGVFRIRVESSKPRIEPLAKSDWPVWALAVAKFGHSEDIGLGDTIVHLIGDERSEWFQTWFQQKFGKSCGCSNRQAWLNQRFPYDI